MSKPCFEVLGYLHNTKELMVESFDSINDANKYASENLESYVIYMRLRLEEKKNECL